MAKLFWEDFGVGQVNEYGRQLVSSEEIKAFAAEFDPQPMHLDEEAARATLVGGLSASGWHTCAIMMRMTADTIRRNQAMTTGSPGVDSCRWLRPVRPGDTLTGRSQVLDVWPSRTKPFGFVRSRVELLNQRDEIVLSLVGLSLYRRREGGA
jgi:acyl dehydratase